LIDELNKEPSLLWYLSKNEHVQRFPETDGEMLLRATTVYALFMNTASGNGIKKFTEECKKSGQAVNPTLLNTETREYALQLHKLEEYMGHTTAFTSKWIKEHLVGVYGGVSNR
jgi:hypothetical protein